MNGNFFFTSFIKPGITLKFKLAYILKLVCDKTKLEFLKQLLIIIQHTV